MALAGFKPYQLVLATRCGLPVPETAVSTVRAVGEAMAQRLDGAVVVKPLSRSLAGLVGADDRAGWDGTVALGHRSWSTPQTFACRFGRRIWRPPFSTADGKFVVYV